MRCGLLFVDLFEVLAAYLDRQFACLWVDMVVVVTVVVEDMVEDMVVVEDVVAVEVGVSVLTTTDKVHKAAQMNNTVHTFKEDKSAVNRTHASDQEYREDLSTTR